MKKDLNSLLKEFEKKSEKALSENRPLWEGTPEDDIYEVDIHIWRKPGMGNTLQTIAGNKVSIMTATTSFLNTLLSKEIISMNDLEYMIKLVKEHKYEEL